MFRPSLIHSLSQVENKMEELTNFRSAHNSQLSLKVFENSNDVLFEAVDGYDQWQKKSTLAMTIQEIYYLMHLLKKHITVIENQPLI